MSHTAQQIIDSLAKPQSQLIVLLLAALRELRVARPKKEVLSQIIESGWYATCPEDMRPYPSQVSSTAEPRSHTLIAWARKECVESALMSDGTRDSWEATTEGKNVVARVKQAVAQGQCSVRLCYYWTPVFKRFIDPNYTPSSEDAQRPKYRYEDDLPPWMSSVRGNSASRELEQFLRTPEGIALMREQLDQLQQNS